MACMTVCPGADPQLYRPRPELAGFVEYFGYWQRETGEPHRSRALPRGAATVIIDAFVIVIIGGMGSFLGSLIGALLIGFVQVFGNYYAPDFALAFMYLVMLAVLVVRPGGLLGKEA